MHKTIWLLTLILALGRWSIALWLKNWSLNRYDRIFWNYWLRAVLFRNALLTLTQLHTWKLPTTTSWMCQPPSSSAVEVGGPCSKARQWCTALSLHPHPNVSRRFGDLQATLVFCLTVVVRSDGRLPSWYTALVMYWLKATYRLCTQRLYCQETLLKRESNIKCTVARIWYEYDVMLSYLHSRRNSLRSMLSCQAQKKKKNVN